MPPKQPPVIKEKKFVVAVSLSQGKHIPFNSSIVRVQCGTESFDIARRGENPVYNETKEIFLTDPPPYVCFTLLENRFFGSATPKGTFKVNLEKSFFDDGKESQKYHACPLSYNAFTENGTGVGQLEVEVKCWTKDKGASVAYREALGVLTARINDSRHLPKLSPSSKPRHVIEVAYGLQRFCTRGSATGKWDDTMRLWIYEQTKEYRIDLTLIERAEGTTTGGTVLGRCLVSAGNWVEANLQGSGEKETTTSIWCEFQAAAATASDRDENVLRANTVDIAAKSAAGDPSSPAIPKDSKNQALKIDFTFTPRAVAEQLFFEGLWRHFDTDSSGALDRVEVAAMMDTLRVNMSDEEMEQFVKSVDANSDGQLDHDEVLGLLRSGNFQASALSAQMMQFLLDGKEGLERMISSIGDGVTMVNGSAVRNTSSGTDADDMGLLIFDRNSGMMLHEHIPWYIKVALKSMYRSGVGRSMAQTSAVRSMLVAQSVAEGKKMDDPASKAKIPGFIEQYGLDLAEIRDPISSFPHFNAFFYRHLKPGARPIDSPTDPTIAVSCADSRMSVFKKMTDATKVWVKGSDFTVEKLLGPRQDLLPLFTNPTLVIARLAPQDYHRVHFPVTGTMGKITEIDGTLYTVNPVAVRQEINVYTENVRHILELNTKEFGKVIMIMVGATMVGSVNVNPQFKKEGAPFNKGDDAGYFAFGGSTTLLLFQPGSIELDQDLVDFSSKPIEVLLKQGQKIGKATGHFAESVSSAKNNLENLRSYFGRFDVDGSGFLSTSEATSCVSLLFPNESLTTIVARIKGADLDGDGKMSFLEFCAIAKDVERLPQSRASLATRLTKFYEKYNKEAISRIPEICDRYEGRADELFSALVAKYGPEPQN
jgi:phosphatidylserine decarboxylase precursor